MASMYIQNLPPRDVSHDVLLPSRSYDEGTFPPRSSSRKPPPPNVKVPIYPIVSYQHPYTCTYMEHPKVCKQLHLVTRGSTTTTPVTSDSIGSTSTDDSTLTTGHIRLKLSRTTAATIRNENINSSTIITPFAALLHIMIYTFPPSRGYRVIAYPVSGVLVLRHIIQHSNNTERWEREVECLVIRCYACDEVAKAAETLTQDTGMPSRNMLNLTGEKAEEMNVDAGAFVPGEVWLTRYLQSLHLGDGWDERDGKRQPAAKVWAAVAVGRKIKFVEWATAPREPGPHDYVKVAKFGGLDQWKSQVAAKIRDDEPIDEPMGLRELDTDGKLELSVNAIWDLQRDCVAIGIVLKLIKDKHWC